MSKESAALTFVLYGATGKRALHDIVPALYLAYRNGRLPRRCRILAVARAPLERDTYLAWLRCATAGSDGASSSLDDGWTGFASQVDYVCADLHAHDASDRLAQSLDRPGGSTIHYLATPPALFPAIGALLHRLPRRRHDRVVVGSLSACDSRFERAVDDALASSFDECRIFRVDRYLGSESVQDLLAFRFGCGSLDVAWNRNWISDIRITTSRSPEAGERPNAGRDAIPLLHLLSIVAMDAPRSADADAVRDERVRVLRALGPSAHAGEPAAARVAIRADVLNPRWQGVPFLLRAGTRPSGGRAVIAVNFKPRDAIPVPVRTRRLDIRLQPGKTPRFDIYSTGLEPGVTGNVLHAELVCNIGQAVAGAHACERLLLDVIGARLASFVRRDEHDAIEDWMHLSQVMCAASRATGTAT